MKMTSRLRLSHVAEQALLAAGRGALPEEELLRLLRCEMGVREAARILRAGGLVAFPTETVYGLGANALDAKAVERIFVAKQRPHWDPVIVHVADVEEARRLSRGWTPAANKLADHFWPGPLTMLLLRREAIPAVCTAGRDKVGLRLPSHPVARALIAEAGVPVAAPSANRFGHTSPTTANHVLADLDGRIDAILDAGECTMGVESTVLDPSMDPVVIYRPGGVTAEAVSELLGAVEVAERRIGAVAVNDRDEANMAGLESPGLGIRHYAPRARVVLVESEAAMQESAVREACGHRVGVLLPRGWRAPAAAWKVMAWGDLENPEMLAHELYAKLREIDGSGVEAIICPLPHDVGVGAAIRDRLRKAAK